MLVRSHGDMLTARTKNRLERVRLDQQLKELEKDSVKQRFLLERQKRSVLHSWQSVPLTSGYSDKAQPPDGPQDNVYEKSKHSRYRLPEKRLMQWKIREQQLEKFLWRFESQHNSGSSKQYRPTPARAKSKVSPTFFKIGQTTAEVLKAFESELNDFRLIQLDGSIGQTENSVLSKKCNSDTSGFSQTDVTSLAKTKDGDHKESQNPKNTSAASGNVTNADVIIKSKSRFQQLKDIHDSATTKSSYSAFLRARVVAATKFFVTRDKVVMKNSFHKTCKEVCTTQSTGDIPGASELEDSHSRKTSNTPAFPSMDTSTESIQANETTDMKPQLEHVSDGHSTELVTANTTNAKSCNQNNDTEEHDQRKQKTDKLQAAKDNSAEISTAYYAPDKHSIDSKSALSNKGSDSDETGPVDTLTGLEDKGNKNICKSAEKPDPQNISSQKVKPAPRGYHKKKQHRECSHGRRQTDRTLKYMLAKQRESNTTKETNQTRSLAKTKSVKILTNKEDQPRGMRLLKGGDAEKQQVEVSGPDSQQDTESKISKPDSQQDTESKISKPDSQRDIVSKVSKPDSQRDIVSKVSIPDSQQDTVSKISKPDSQRDIVSKVSKPDSQQDTESKVSKPDSQQDTVSKVSKADSQQDTVSNVSKADSQQDTVSNVSKADSQQDTVSNVSKADSQQGTVSKVSKADPQQDTVSNVSKAVSQQDTVSNVSKAVSQQDNMSKAPKPHSQGDSVSKISKNVSKLSKPECQQDTMSKLSKPESEQDTVSKLSKPESQQDTISNISKPNSQQDTVSKVSRPDLQQDTVSKLSKPESQQHTTSEVSKPDSQQDTRSKRSKPDFKKKATVSFQQENVAWVSQPKPQQKTVSNAGKHNRSKWRRELIVEQPVGLRASSDIAAQGTMGFSRAARRRALIHLVDAYSLDIQKAIRREKIRKWQSRAALLHKIVIHVPMEEDVCE